MSFFEQALNSTSERSRKFSSTNQIYLTFYNECLQNRRRQWISATANEMSPLRST